MGSNESGERPQPLQARSMWPPFEVCGWSFEEVGHETEGTKLLPRRFPELGENVRSRRMGKPFLMGIRPWETGGN